VAVQILSPEIRVSLSHFSPSLVTVAAPFSGELFFSDLVHGVRQWLRIAVWLAWESAGAV